MRFTFRLSIRDTLILTIGGLTLLIVSSALYDTLNSGKNLERIRTLKTATLLSDRLFDANEKLAVERDISLSILYAPSEEIIDDLRPRLESSRKGADDALRLTLQELQIYDLPGLAILSRNSEAQIITIQKLRRKIDRAIILPAGERKRELSEQCFDEITKLIFQTQDIWSEFAKYFIDIDPTMTRHIRFKQFLGVIMEYSGRSRALIGRLIVENVPPTPRDQANLLRWQGATELSWDMASTMAVNGGLYNAVKPYFKDAKSHYYTVYDMVRDSFYIPGAIPEGTYPISVEMWLDLATQASDSLYSLNEASLKETKLFMETLEDTALRAITLKVLLLLSALFLCFFSFRVINRRVVAPITNMVDTLVVAIEGKNPLLKPSSASQQNEIDELTSMLHRFQQDME